MDTYIGEDGLTKTWQADFPKETECVHCKDKARIGFVAHESGDEGKFVCNLHENKKDEMWLHDVCAVAVYFCKKCLNTTALYNQG